MTEAQPGQRLRPRRMRHRHPWRATRPCGTRQRRHRHPLTSPTDHPVSLATRRLQGTPEPAIAGAFRARDQLATWGPARAHQFVWRGSALDLLWIRRTLARSLRGSAIIASGHARRLEVASLIVAMTTGNDVLLVALPAFLVPLGSLAYPRRAAGALVNEAKQGRVLCGGAVAARRCRPASSILWRVPPRAALTGLGRECMLGSGSAHVRRAAVRGRGAW